MCIVASILSYKYYQYISFIPCNNGDILWTGSSTVGGVERGPQSLGQPFICNPHIALDLSNIIFIVIKVIIFVLFKPNTQCELLASMLFGWFRSPVDFQIWRVWACFSWFSNSRPILCLSCLFACYSLLLVAWFQCSVCICTHYRLSIILALIRLTICWRYD